MKRMETRRRWGSLVGEQAESGLSIAEFCRRNDLSPDSFYQWRKKLKTASAAAEPFVSVSVLATAEVSIELPCGAVVRLAAGDERSLAQVLSVLMAAGAAE